MPRSTAGYKQKPILDSLLLGMRGVAEGKMFGFPAYYVNGKLFACLYGSGVGVKVPEHVADKLLSRNDIVHFQPYGKVKMREWIQINRAKPEDYRKDKRIFCVSVEFVGQPRSAVRGTK
ncbi:MAG: hypothetical protein SF051_03515 [Elusimicrobiota bacterium]|nr:hypothetical protein [Elusimicrobiota bacterium]